MMNSETFFPNGMQRHFEFLDVSPGLKRPEREADHSPVSSSKIKNAWSHTSVFPHIFLA
jgi:hypothetical protein